jgi:hypothetical protein
VKRKVLVVVAILSALTLSACSQVNMAAKVGKQIISTNQVQGSVNQILKERQGFDTSQSNLPSGKDLNLSVLQFHLYSALFDQIAKEIQLPVSDGEVAKERASIVSRLGAEDKIPTALVNASIAKADFPRYLRTVVIASKLREALAKASGAAADDAALQKLLITAGKKQGVTINPRYGTWNYETGMIDKTTKNPAIK